MSSLAPNMQGLQLFRLNNLVHHIQHHFGADWTWTEMKDFVLEHYTSTQLLSDPNDKEHESLPFKSVTQTAMNTVVADASIKSIEVRFYQFPEENQKPQFKIPNSIPIDRSGNIWTPPQLS